MKPEHYQALLDQIDKEPGEDLATRLIDRLIDNDKQLRQQIEEVSILNDKRKRQAEAETAAYIYRTLSPQGREFMQKELCPADVGLLPLDTCNIIINGAELKRCRECWTKAVPEEG